MNQQQQERSPSIQKKVKPQLIAVKQSFIRQANAMKLSQSGLFQRPQTTKRNQSAHDLVMTRKLYQMMAQYIPKDIKTIQKSIVNHVEYTLARTRLDFKSIHCYQAVAHSVRDRLIQMFNDTHRQFHKEAPKQINYLSLQFLLGRCLQNAVVNINLQSEYKMALQQLGYQWEKLASKQVDPALGNGGLGRLAACFLDSLATLNYPSWGYGIRYDYGIFRQQIKQGNQIQVPDFWLMQGNPWQIERVDVQYPIKFYGKSRKYKDLNGNQKMHWQDYETVVARAYDTPIPGYATFNTIGLRLWKSMPANEFDFKHFNQGDYFEAIKDKQKAQYITSVLYPNDSHTQGKQLRLKQQYLLVSASIQDIIRRDKSRAKFRGQHYSWKSFSSRVAIQLNDTHPALAIVELMRILLDQQGLTEEQAWQIVSATCAYTNHTVLPQALQKWSVQILGKLLPRHLEIIYQINYHWLHRVQKKFPENLEKLSALSLVQQSSPKSIRMAHLSIVGSHTVNGVAFFHSQLLKKSLFKDFYDIFPKKFVNVTNGVTTRRWILCANPLLANLYDTYLKSDSWVLNMSELIKLQKLADNQSFQHQWRAIKQANKVKLAEWIRRQCHVNVSLDSLFDVQVKRIHQYKRQFMNILYVIWRYLWIKSLSAEQKKNIVSRTVMFAGKAAPGYITAKKIIKLINQVSYVINNDNQTNSLLKVVFLPNYSVSNAQIIIPATQLSQHISTAGLQASGTSNMKFVLNGSLIIGTMDGANVQIYEQVGDDNIFIFGAKIDDIQRLRKDMYSSPPEKYIPQPLKDVFDAIREGTFGGKEVLTSLIETITKNNDFYLVCADFNDYIQAQAKVDETYKDQHKWTRMSILNALRTGKFSSDRSIKQYAQKIWNLKPFKVVVDSQLNTCHSCPENA